MKRIRNVLSELWGSFLFSMAIGKDKINLVPSSCHIKTMRNNLIS